jgi:integrase
MKFTDRSIQSLKPKDERYIVWKDGGDGLGLRVSPKGKKTFIYMYRFDGRARMMTLGDYPRVSLSKANMEHSNAADQLKRGFDPGSDKVASRKAEREAETVKELVSEYLEKWAKPRKRSWEEDERILEKDILPKWKYRKAKDIKRKDVIAILDEVVNRGAAIQANRTFGIIRKMFNFAVSRDIVPFSPCAGVSPPSAENQRDRVLTDAEIKQLWNKLDDAKMHNNTKLAIRLILTTAQRAGEVVSAEWSEIDIDGGWWLIPAEKAKNNLPHRVPLSPLAKEVLKQIKPYSGASLYLFPSPLSPKIKEGSKRKSTANPEKRKDKPIDESALGHALRNNLERLGLENVVPHDLRRTAASHITGMGISRLVVSKLLNHVERGVTAVYDRYSYDAEKRKALIAWGKKITSILSKPESKGESTVFSMVVG